MSKTLTTQFQTTPDTHSAANGHWDKVGIEGSKPVDIDMGNEPSPYPPLPLTYLQIQFQNGPVKEHGVNGVQLTDVLRICLARYKMLNKSFPCRENSLVITKLQEAIMWDEERTAKRTTQGVEGFDKPHHSGE